MTLVKASWTAPIRPNPLGLSEYAEPSAPTVSDPSTTWYMVMTYLFTVIAFFVVGGVALFANRQQRFSTDDVQINARHMRQELRVIAYLLAGVVILLGVIADKIQ
jgi:threonine/homoserine/homoserine lactone efflux protein